MQRHVYERISALVWFAVRNQGRGALRKRSSFPPNAPFVSHPIPSRCDANVCIAIQRQLTTQSACLLCSLLCMEVAIAVVQLRQSALADRHVRSAHDYELLLVNEPSSSSRTFARLQLPRTRVAHKKDPTDFAFKLFRQFSSTAARRAVVVPLWDDNSNGLSLPGSPHPRLYCVPVLEKDKGLVKSNEIGRFENFSRVLNLCMNDSDSIDVEARHFILRLEEWLREEQMRDVHFLASLFLCSASLGRVRLCAHNPAYDPEESMMCHSMIGHGNNGDGQRKSCDLADEVRRGNDARAWMIGCEKYDMFILNPIFGSGFHSTNEDEGVTYFAKGRTESMSGSFSSVAVENWAETYPLHKAAYEDNVNDIKRLIGEGMSPNQVDNTSWTPLHYCAFYNRLKSLEVLLLSAGTNVNVPNKAGSTALHFAALQANAYMVELLLSHSNVDINARNCKGQRALDVCACVPKPEYQKVAKLLRQWIPLQKIQVEVMDGGNAQLALAHGQETTAGDLHAEMCKELKLNTASSALFAMWICSERLSLQLKADHKPLLHMNKWKSKVAKFGNEEYHQEDDKPRLVFRRDARISLLSEQMALRSNFSPNALSLLYEEARYNYLQGLYPCHDDDVATLASIVLQIISGLKCHVTEKVLPKIVPPHRIPTNEAALKAFIYRIEKKYNARSPANLSKLQLEFLKACWRFLVYGCTFFDATLFMSKPSKATLPMHVGVNDYGLHLIHQRNKTLFNSYALKGIRWTPQADKPCLDVDAWCEGHHFTLRTPQANNISTLLTRLKEMAK